MKLFPELIYISSVLLIIYCIVVLYNYKADIQLKYDQEK